MNDIDLLMMARSKAGLDKNLKGIYLIAADIYKDENVADDIDLLKMVRILMHGLNWNQVQLNSIFNF